MKSFLLAVLSMMGLALVPAGAEAVNETEPNDTKAQANVITLPAVSAPSFIVGTSTSAAGAGLDYFRLTTAAQATPDFYRHRLVIQSAIPGHTGTIRGLSQTSGVIDPVSDVEFQASSAATSPPRFVQWYTSEAPATVYVRVTGTAATSASYLLDYDVQPVSETVVTTANIGGQITITTVGQTSVDTDFWVYREDRTAWADRGNDDHFNGPTSQSTLTRNYPPSMFPYYFVAISDANTANNLPSPADDDNQNGNVLDFPGATANSSAAINQVLDPLVIDAAAPRLISATKAGPFDVVFFTLYVALPVELTDFYVE
jgi:hypothetical protein